MHIQIINFHLKDLGQEAYERLCDELAPAFGKVDGLLSKVWLRSPETNTYGGIYTWRDKEAMNAFSKTEMFHSVTTHPNLSDITSRDFAVMESPTRVTRGLGRAGRSRRE